MSEIWLYALYIMLGLVAGIIFFLACVVGTATFVEKFLKREPDLEMIWSFYTIILILVILSLFGSSCYVYFK